MTAGEPLERDQRRSGRASGRVSHLVAAPFALLALAFAAAPASASAPVSSENAAATHIYLIAEYKLVRALLHKATAVRRSEAAAAAQIAQECRGVLSGMPWSSLNQFTAPTPLVRGEDARFIRQEQTIGAEFYSAIATPGKSLYRPAEEAYAAEVRQLSWSDPTLATQLQAETSASLERVSTPAPPFCADARAWAQSGYRALSTASREFEAAPTARRSSTLREEPALDTLLKPFENAADRALSRKTEALVLALLANALATIQTNSHSRRIIGFPHSAVEDTKKPVVLGHGRTAAGTRFKMSTGASGILGSLGSGGSCHRSVSVFYSRPGSSPEDLVQGGPNNPICLSPPQVRHPALFCEEGTETIQTAVPASVRSIRLMLADGRTIESHVVRVPRRDGGPAGIYAQEIRGSSSHAVSLVELGGDDEVVLRLKLARYRCVKPKEPEFPASAKLAAGQTPEGEPFTISTFGTFNGQPSLSVDAGVDPDINEPTFGPQPPKAFPWWLSIDCAPHPYAILYGILAPPGKSVTARTPEGTVALNAISIEPRVHAKGPLVYGVFRALPSELTIVGANGSPLYTESLEVQATEVAQFCEGYAEPAS
jgi:hypothetical protein